MLVGAKYRVGSVDWVDQHRFYVDMQNKRCAVCGFRDPTFLSLKLVLDHDHKTGEVRGAVCVSCNVRIGIVEAGRIPRKNLKAILMYLDSHKVSSSSIVEYFGQGL